MTFDETNHFRSQRSSSSPASFRKLGEPKRFVKITPWWVSNEKNRCLGYIGDYTTKLCGDYNRPLQGSLLNNQYNGKKFFFFVARLILRDRELPFHSEKSPTVGPTERTPKKPEYLIARASNLLPTGSLGIRPCSNFWWDSPMAGSTYPC